MIEINKIYCENHLKTMARMPDNFLDLTVTSPPYDDMDENFNPIPKKGLREYSGYQWDFKAMARELFRTTKQGGVVVWVVGDKTKNGCETLTSFKQAIFFVEQCGFLLFDTMFWQKTNPIPSDPRIGRYVSAIEYMFVFSKGVPKTTNLIREKSIHANKIILSTNPSQRKFNGSIRDDRIEKRKRNPISEYKIKSNVWDYELFLNRESSFHPAPFPEDLAHDHIYSWSNEGDLVYDPFMGSGTVAKMAHLLKRRWIGSEISQEYVDLANKRLDPYLRQTMLEI